MILAATRCTAYAGIVLLLTACQRLPGEDGPATSASGNGTTQAEGGTFLPQDDTGDETSDPDGSPMCELVQQTGCNAGEKCTVIGSAGGMPVAGCVADTGSLEPFDPCESLGAGVDACPAGFACIVDFANSGACLPLCEGNADCDLGVCLSATSGSAPYCADDCSPFESLCAAPTQCRRNGERFSCRVPRETDVGGQGASCEPNGDGGCTSGLVCVAGALVPECVVPNCCTSLCDLEGGDPCDSPATCNSALSAPAPGFENIGACFVPA